MLARQYKFYPPEEYLAVEEQAKQKSEYYDGDVVALAGSSLNHNRIAKKICFIIDSALSDKPCEVFFAEIKVRIEARNFFTYPDVMVVCGDPKFVENRSDTITNPKIIIEVLSKSTERYDRSNKFHAYWTLDSLEEYVLVDQYRMRVEYFKRISEKEWMLRVLTKPDEALALQAIDLEIPLSDIYQRIEWEDEAEDEDVADSSGI